MGGGAPRAPTPKSPPPATCSSGDPEPVAVSHELSSTWPRSHRALVPGRGGYVHKNGFRGVVVGLSGGIDRHSPPRSPPTHSARECGVGVTMPSRFSSPGSVEDSRALARQPGIRFDEIPIEPSFTGFLSTLEGVFAETPPDVTEENSAGTDPGSGSWHSPTSSDTWSGHGRNKSEIVQGDSPPSMATWWGGYGASSMLEDTGVRAPSPRWRNRDGRGSSRRPRSTNLRPVSRPGQLRHRFTAAL